MRELVSVIILSYRNHEGIYQTLQSILEQTYENIELVFSDDGSPGFDAETGKINRYIEANQKGNITGVVFNAVRMNGGTVKNVNGAIRLSHGRYIKVLGAEDMLSRPDALSVYVDYMETHKSRIVFAKIRGILPDGSYRYRLVSCELDYGLLKSYTVRQTRERLFGRNFLPAPAWMADAGIFREYGLFPECVRLIEDYPYWLHLTACGVKFDYLDEILVDYRLSGISSAGSYGEEFMRDMLVIYDRFIFPFDRRFGVLQPVYNVLKRGGLNYYMLEAGRGGMTCFQKICTGIKYFPFRIYVSLQDMMNDMANKRLYRKRGGNQ